VPMRCCTSAEAQSVRFHRSSTQRTSKEASRARGDEAQTRSKIIHIRTILYLLWLG
jgi:hypothetical protein